ncbi:MAG: transposase family protein [bacterium]|nr:transposase family protein [bacterium]
MSAVAQSVQNVSPVVKAALLLVARALLVHLGFPCPKVSEILAVTGAGRSRAYELARAIPAAVTGLVRPPGRPALEHESSPPDVRCELRDKVIAFLIEHPGCVTTRGRRRRYSDDYHRFVLELAEKSEELSEGAFADFAEAVAVPLPTLRDWLRAPVPEAEPPDDETVDQQDAASARIETVLNEWKQWTGGFVPFCDHLREHLRIEWGLTMIAGILEKAGVRLPRKRGRSRRDGTLRGAFETFFPGAQWAGDGSTMTVEIGPCRFTFNVELLVDADSGAFVGLSVRDEEDAAAVIEAFDDGVKTAESSPIAIELDGRPSNHCDKVKEETGETIVIRSTPKKPQSNPHVEGAFGLFKQIAPPLVVVGNDRKEIARQIVALVFVTWARTLNNKPRSDRGGATRVELYNETEPTAEQVERVRKALLERQRRQERRLEKAKARMDPAVRAVVDEQWSKLDLDDPDGRVRDAIAGFPLDAVLAAIATFEAKKTKGTLPPSVDARYLLGIVRNISQTDEGQAITEALLRIRLEARDSMLARLAAARDTMLASTKDTDSRIRAAIAHAMEAHRNLDRLFWLQLAANLITEQNDSPHLDLVRSASRRIHACFAVPYWDRLAAVRFLAEQVVSLA